VGTTGSDNNKKLQDFFSQEYKSLKAYINRRLATSASYDAEDIIQEVALRLFARADKTLPITNVTGFVYYAIKNKLVDLLRSNKRYTTQDIQEESPLFASMLTALIEDHYSDETIILLRKSIATLKPHYKEVIWAIDYQGYSYQELAEETGIPAGTLMSRRHRAIAILHKKLKNQLNQEEL
jgi:RNA polymerase sigma-70 factor (ECF subfamily)